MAKHTTQARRLAEPAPSAAQDAFRQSVLAGLGSPRKTLECKYFYDEQGAELFDEICRQPEYYLTRVETEILERCAPEVAARTGPGAELVELGSGASLKTRILLRALERPARYLPVDISPEYLQSAAARLTREFPRLAIRPVIADFTVPFRLPPRAAGVPRLLFFPGSTIGNFHRDDAARFLAGTCLGLAPDALLIGVDLKKDRAVLEAAYNDAAGVTEAFNRNLLARINRDLGARFDLQSFDHVATYAEQPGRVEIYLRSNRDQTVRVAGQDIHFAAGEMIHTENSYKYSVDDVHELAARSGWRLRHSWIDDGRRFAVHLLKPA